MVETRGKGKSEIEKGRGKSENQKLKEGEVRENLIEMLEGLFYFREICEIKHFEPNIGKFLFYFNYFLL